MFRARTVVLRRHTTSTSSSATMTARRLSSEYTILYILCVNVGSSQPPSYVNTKLDQR